MSADEYRLFLMYLKKTNDEQFFDWFLNQPGHAENVKEGFYFSNTNEGLDYWYGIYERVKAAAAGTGAP